MTSEEITKRREMEIMACGLPKIANRLFGIQEVLDSLGFGKSPMLEFEIENVLKIPIGSEEPDIGALIDKPFVDAVIAETKPHWDGTFLTWASYSWHFHNYPGPIRDLFNALEAAGWPHSVKLDHLDERQVADAVKYLNNEKKPIGVIRWHGSADGTFSWEILPHSRRMGAD